jgi:hypothetical protein
MVPVGRGRIKEMYLGEYAGSMYACIRKMRFVETIPGVGGVWGQGRMIEVVNSSVIYLISCKNFCKCHNVPPLSITIKN